MNTKQQKRLNRWVRLRSKRSDKALARLSRYFGFDVREVFVKNQGV